MMRTLTPSRIHAKAGTGLLALACFVTAAQAQSDTTLVNTPSGGAAGSLVTGNVVKANGPHGVIDSGIAASSVSTATNTQTLQNKSISGAQNALTNVPDAALSSNVDLLNGAQTFSALKTFAGGLALPSASDPAGSNLYVDSNQCLHVVTSFMDAQLVGCKFNADATRPWFTVPMGFGNRPVDGTTRPLIDINRQEFYSGGGSSLTFGARSVISQGQGFSQTLLADAANGATTLTIQANANITIGMKVYGPCVQTGETVASYSTGTLGLTLGTNCALAASLSPVITIKSGTGEDPTNPSKGLHGEIDEYTSQTGSSQAPNGISGYFFKYVPSTVIAQGGNILARDETGRKSSVAGGGLTGTEFDEVASGPDDANNRSGTEVIYSENSRSIDGATAFAYGIKIHPAAALRNSDGSADVVCAFCITTMLNTGGSPVNGGFYGTTGDAFSADGGERIGVYDFESGLVQYQPSVLASSGQAVILFPYGSNINANQFITGSANIPANTYVLSTVQCSPTSPLTACGSTTNAEKVTLSADLTGNVTTSTTLSFTGSTPHGSYFNGIFTGDFANWTSQLTGGVIKAGTLLNSGTVLDIQGFGEDSTNTTGVEYGDIKFGVTSNTHGSAVGFINLVPVGGGSVQVGGVALGSNAFTSTTYAPLSSPSLTGTVTFPEGTTVGASWSINSAIAMGNHGISGWNTIIGNNTNSVELFGNAAASATNPTLVPNRSDQKAGIGADIAGNLSLIIDSTGTATEMLRLTSAGGQLNGGLVAGSATGGNEGSGTINAQGLFINGVAVGTGAGTVTTTGSPASGNLARFSSGTSVTNGDLSGDCTTSGTLAVTCTKSNGTLLSSLFAPLASPTFSGTVTFPEGTAVGASWTMSSGIAMANHAVSGWNNVTGTNTSSAELIGNSSASSTVPTVIPNRASTTTGLGAQASGNFSGIVAGSEIWRTASDGFHIESGAYFSGATSGVTCSGSPTASFASANGIVTHC